MGSKGKSMAIPPAEYYRNHTDIFRSQSRAAQQNLAATQGIAATQGLLGGLGQYQGNYYDWKRHALEELQCSYFKEKIKLISPKPPKEKFTHDINYNNSLLDELKKWRKGWLDQ